MNKKVKNLIQRLGEAIHETVSESEHVAGVVKDIRDQGFDVLLMLEATIGLNEVEPEPKLELGDGKSAAEAASGKGPFTSHDLHFLKSLRISMTEDAADDATDDATSVSQESSATSGPDTSGPDKTGPDTTGPGKAGPGKAGPGKASSRGKAIGSNPLNPSNPPWMA